MGAARMKVGIIQSNYIPWRGYFDFIHDVDLFIVHDDLQYTKGDWRNRNQIKTTRGLKWLTVPVHYDRTTQLICDTKIDYSQPWQKDHEGQLRANYAKAPYLNDALDLLTEAFVMQDVTISALNQRLLRSVNDYLGITTPLRDSLEYGVSGRKTERIIALCRAVGATTYLSGPAAKSYIDAEALHRAGIALEWKGYSYPPYPQQGEGFEGAVTVLDLIANTGPDAAAYIWGPQNEENSARTESRREGVHSLASPGDE